MRLARQDVQQRKLLQYWATALKNVMRVQPQHCVMRGKKHFVMRAQAQHCVFQHLSFAENDLS